MTFVRGRLLGIVGIDMPPSMGYYSVKSRGYFAFLIKCDGDDCLFSGQGQMSDMYIAIFKALLATSQMN